MIFTEFVATQEMLRDFLEGRGYSVATLDGGMNIALRKTALENFRADAQVLVSTDAGGVGLNMQFAHVVFNYDLPFSPMKVEQRIGRLDRIGQKRTVQALNLVLENSVEARLYDIWQVKLATILAEFGVDKTGDVLDSTTVSSQFDRLARTAIFNPTSLDHEFDRIVTEVRKSVETAVKVQSLYRESIQDVEPAPTVPLDAWLATMQGGSRDDLAVGGAALSERLIAQINALTPYFAEGKPVSQLTLSRLGFSLDGWFSVWKVGIAEGLWQQQQVFSLFTSLDGKSFGKSAQRIWDELATRQATIQVCGEMECTAFAEIAGHAEAAAAELYQAVLARAGETVRHRLTALDTSYLARRAALAQIELGQIRETRRQELEMEYRRRKSETARIAEALPELRCLFLARMTVT